MISLDRGLLGIGTGDVVARHRLYAESCTSVSIVIPTKPGFEQTSLSGRLNVYPTNAHTTLGHIRAVFFLFKSIRKHSSINLIVTQDLAAPVAWLLARWFATPYIVSVHGVWWDRWFIRKRVWNGMYVKCMMWLFSRADAIRVVSEGLKSGLVARGIKPAKINIIPTPIELIRFGKTAGQEPASTTEQIVLSVGRLEEEKRFDLLLQAWKRVVEKVGSARLLIAGDGGKRVALAGIVKTLGISAYVHFLGDIPVSDLPEYYHKASIFTLASDSESFGKVLVEAGAASLPVVATDTLGARTVVIPDKTGYLVPIGDKDALADKIIYLLQNNDEARNMGEEAARFVNEQFGWEKNIAKIVHLWRKTAR